MAEIGEQDKDQDFINRSGWWQHWNWCANYNSPLFNKKCAAGMLYSTVRIEIRGELQRHLSPCFQENGMGHRCPKVKYLTVEEAREVEAREAIIHEKQHKEYMGNISKGICPHCKASMTIEQVESCIYARPCGHRLGTGTLSEGEGQ